MKMMSEEELLKALAINVLTYRKRKEISRENLAKTIGVTSNYIEKIENGKLKETPQVEIAYKIAIVLGVTLDSLLDENNIAESNLQR